MKRNIIAYLRKVKDDILGVSEFLYNNPEVPFQENKAAEYIIQLLQGEDFEVERGVLDTETAFIAKKGEGHPKVCYICKYSAPSNEGHVYGTNASCAMSLGAAIALGGNLKELNQHTGKQGTVYVIGCPGSEMSGSELDMAHQGIFEDMDIIIQPHAYNETLESGTSMATSPLKVKFEKYSEKVGVDLPDTSPIDACNMISDILGVLVKNMCYNCSITTVSIIGSPNPYEYPIKAEGSFYIRTQNIEDAKGIEDDVKKVITSIAKLYGLESEISLFDIPSKELKSNPVLTRIFTNNLKEAGIIDIGCCRFLKTGLGIGAVSHTTPTIYPAIGIVETESVPYPSIEFAKATQEEFAKDKILQAAHSMANTAVDIIQKDDERSSEV